MKTFLSRVSAKSAQRPSAHTIAIVWCTFCVVSALTFTLGCRVPDESFSGGNAAATGGGTAGGFETGVGGTGDALSSCVSDGLCQWPEETCACADCKSRQECVCPADGNCPATEACSCPDCAEQPRCKEGCVDDGVCFFPAPESCQCPDCQLDPWSCPGGCVDDPDGICDIMESCDCVDCHSSPLCADALSTCEGGVNDGVCAASEPCACIDCTGWGRCVEPICDSVSECIAFDWCICAGCNETPSCVAVGQCEDNGLCTANEGCFCLDCAAAPACAPLGLAQSCQAGVSDGICGPGEGCSCVDCANTVDCMYCNDDGICSGTEGCLCPNCEGIPAYAPSGFFFSWTHHCYPGWSGTGIPCVDDGICRPWSEGCGCADCMPSSHCVDNVASCEGGAADGTCSDTDPCSCPDCHWTGKCVELNCDPPDGLCAESRLCPDCVGEPSQTCIPDGYCNDQDEGCDCPDCANAATCPM